ncbi:CPBP family intramembrane metalloprotease [candidate division KSB1 bacterium]|nr:CPBP family intramembrane metalloprotease [candidate division KSB1 bacterium]
MNDLKIQDNSILPIPFLGLLILITFIFVFGIGGLIALLIDSKASLFAEVLIIVPAVILVLVQNRPFLRSFRIKTIPFSIIIYTVFIALAVFILGDELDRIIDKFFPMPGDLRHSLENLFIINSWTDAVIIVFPAVIFAGVAEEMLFRGIVQRSLELQKEPAVAIVLTSVVFAIIHMNPWVSLQITFLGLVLGYMAWKTGSILPAIILHAMNNLLSIILINLPKEIIDNYSGEHVHFKWIVTAIIVLLVTFPAFIKYCENRNKELS